MVLVKRSWHKEFQIYEQFKIENWAFLFFSHPEEFIVSYNVPAPYNTPGALLGGELNIHLATGFRYQGPNNM